MEDLSASPRHSEAKREASAPAALSGRGGRDLTSDRAVCVWIPLFPLRAEERRHPDLIGKPTALLAAEDTRRLWQVSARARHAGVRPGMTVSQAIGLCPLITLLEADPVHYDEQFSHLLIALGNVTPVIEPVELGRVFVGVDGLERLVGTPEKQVAAIEKVVRQSGGRVDSLRPPVEEWGGLRLGSARGKFAAWVAATRAKPGEPVIVSDGALPEFLSTQPVAVLPLHPDTHRRLWQLGLKRLGDLAALPEDAVRSQFGREGTTARRLASGLSSEPVIGRETPEPIVASIELPTPIADRDMLAQTLGKLTEEALGHPRRAGWRVHVVRARAGLEHGASWMVGVTLNDPSASREHIAQSLRTKLEQTPPNGAVEHLAIEFTAFVRGTSELQLFARDATAAARAGRRRALRWAAREIKTRLKRSMLHHVIEVHPWSRIPERRYALIDFDP